MVDGTHYIKFIRVKLLTMISKYSKRYIDMLAFPSQFNNRSVIGTTIYSILNEDDF